MTKSRQVHTLEKYLKRPKATHLRNISTVKRTANTRLTIFKINLSSSLSCRLISSKHKDKLKKKLRLLDNWIVSRFQGFFIYAATLGICNIEIFTRFSSLCHTDSRKVKEKVAGKREFKKKEKKPWCSKNTYWRGKLFKSPPPVEKDKTECMRGGGYWE